MHPHFTLKNVHIYTQEGKLVHFEYFPIQNGCYTSSQSRIPPVITTPGWIILPGYIDMHSHISRYPQYIPDLFRWGITGVREAGGPWNAHEQWQRIQIKPDASFAGPLIDGEPPRWPHISMPLHDEKDIPNVITLHKQFGCSWVKIYCRLRHTLVKKLVHSAHKAGLRVLGHLGRELSIKQALTIGFDSLEHVRFGWPDKLLPSKLNTYIRNLPWPEKDVEFWLALNIQNSKLRALWHLWAKNQTVWVPTLINWLPLLRQLPRTIPCFPAWHALRWHMKRKALTLPSPDKVRWAFEKILQAVHQAWIEGVPIFPGTDSPYIYALPGRSFHIELSFLSRAGIPLEYILRAACYESRSLLGFPTPFEEGQRASFVLIKTSAIKSVRDLKNIAGVYHQKRWVYLDPQWAINWS